MPYLNYYDLLGIPRTANQQEIRQSYHIRVRVIHPDRFDPIHQRKEWEKANEMLAELNEAYSVLRNAEKRAEYDLQMGYTRGRADSAHGNETKTNARRWSDESTDEEEEEQSDQGNNETSAKNEPSKQTERPKGPKRVRFATLPLEVQQKLVKRHQKGGDRFVYRTRTLLPEVCTIAFGLGWLGALFYLSFEYRWSNDEAVLFGAVTAGSTLALWLGSKCLR